MNFTLSAATYRRWKSIAKDPDFLKGLAIGALVGCCLFLWLLIGY